MKNFNIVQFVIIVIMAVPLAIWLYRDARARDYSWLFWTIMPLIALFSPMAMAVLLLLSVLVIYLILRPKGELIKCPHCNKNIHDILVICPFCKKEAKRECLNCHEPVPWEAEQCPFCKSRALTGKNL